MITLKSSAALQIKEINYITLLFLVIKMQHIGIYFGFFMPALVVVVCYIADDTMCDPISNCMLHRLESGFSHERIVIINLA